MAFNTEGEMRKVFWEDSYRQRLITKISAVSGNRVLLEETIGFSFSGGQESDQTRINGLPALDSEIEDKLIYYTLKENHGFQPGDQVLMEIDWPRRFKLMRLHFAAELILELVTQRKGLEKIGAHIGETKARIDFVFDKNISCIFEGILSEYNEIIAKDEMIKTGYFDEENQRRFWKIDGFAEVPCGGTHVKSTSEVGFIKLKRVNIGRGKERIEIFLAEHAYE